MGSLFSGLLGGGSSPGQEAQLEALRQARADMQRYRPELAQAHLNAGNQEMAAYQGMNNALETGYGGHKKTEGRGYVQDMFPMGKNRY